MNMLLFLYATKTNYFFYVFLSVCKSQLENLLSSIKIINCTYSINHIQMIKFFADSSILLVFYKINSSKCFNYLTPKSLSFLKHGKHLEMLKLNVQQLTIEGYLILILQPFPIYDKSPILLHNNNLDVLGILALHNCYIYILYIRGPEQIEVELHQTKIFNLKQLPFHTAYIWLMGE